MNLQNGTKPEGESYRDLQDAENEKLIYSDKVFNYSPLPKCNVKRETNSDGKRVYVTPEGNSFISVTTALSNVENKNLNEWRKAVGEDEALKITKRAANYGSLFHDTIEKYLLNNLNESTLNPFLKSQFRSFKPYLNKIDNIRLIEGMVYSNVLRLGGTLDCLAEYESKPSIIDFKTASKEKDKSMIYNYFLQCTAYSYMIEERYSIKIPDIVIMVSVESDKPQIFKDNRINWRKELKCLKQYY